MGGVIGVSVCCEGIAQITYAVYGFLCRSRLTLVQRDPIMRTLLYRRYHGGGPEHRMDRRRKQVVRAGEAAHATRSVITRKPPALGGVF
jgi:hypothetical protein